MTTSARSFPKPVAAGTTADYVREVFAQNNGAVTVAFYEALAALGPLGLVARDLFRAQKRSNAAKRYKRGRFKREAYEVKQYAMSELAKTLTEHADALQITWGWGYDAPREPHAWVLYVQTDDRWQCSYHTGARGNGPDFPLFWDGGNSEAAMVAFVAHVIDALTSKGDAGPGDCTGCGGWGYHPHETMPYCRDAGTCCDQCGGTGTARPE